MSLLNSDQGRGSRKASLHEHGTILHVLCIGFHHKEGPIVEFANPELPDILPSQSNSSSPPRSRNASKDSLISIALPRVWAHLPFIALPDGSHYSLVALVFIILEKKTLFSFIYHLLLDGMSTINPRYSDSVFCAVFLTNSLFSSDSGVRTYCPN